MENLSPQRIRVPPLRMSPSRFVNVPPQIKALWHWPPTERLRRLLCIHPPRGGNSTLVCQLTSLSNDNVDPAPIDGWFRSRWRDVSVGGTRSTTPGVHVYGRWPSSDTALALQWACYCVALRRVWGGLRVFSTRRLRRESNAVSGSAGSCGLRLQEPKRQDSNAGGYDEMAASLGRLAAREVPPLRCRACSSSKRGRPADQPGCELASHRW